MSTSKETTSTPGSEPPGAVAAAVEKAAVVEEALTESDGFASCLGLPASVGEMIRGQHEAFGGRVAA